MKAGSHFVSFILLVSLLSIICIKKRDIQEPGTVNMYQLTYETPGTDGTLVTASGVVFVPPSGTGPYPLLSCQHGTLFSRKVAPSYTDSYPETQAWLSEFAAKGYVVVIADYIGLGKAGKSRHPNFHTETEATSARDMIRAARKFCADRGILLGNNLFLAGYSQGGHVTTGLHLAGLSTASI